MPTTPRPVDVLVGQRLRLRRSQIGMSQERLAELLGITYQQVQKYERGANRIGSSRLHDIARHLDVPVAWLFEGAEIAGNGRRGLSEDAPGFVLEGGMPAHGTSTDASQSRETADLVSAFKAIADPVVRLRLLDLARALANRPAVSSKPDGDA